MAGAWAFVGQRVGKPGVRFPQGLRPKFGTVGRRLQGAAEAGLRQGGAGRGEAGRGRGRGQARVALA